jgi:hypothetical protein
VETDVRKLVIIVVGVALGIPILLYGLDVVLPPVDVPAPVAEAQLADVDPSVTEQSLGYLTRKTDVSKVVVRGSDVFIAFNTKPKDEDLAAIVNEAALKFAGAASREIYVHGTHLDQMASVGTPDFREYCRTHAGVGPGLGEDGKPINKPMMLESTC